MRRLAPTVAVLAGLALSAQGATAADQALVSKLGRYARAAGSYSGAYVVNLTDGETVFAGAPDGRGILARIPSCSPLRPRWRSSAPRARWAPKCVAWGWPRAGSARRPLSARRRRSHLRSRRFTRRAYGTGATVESWPAAWRRRASKA